MQFGRSPRLRIHMESMRDLRELRMPPRNLDTVRRNPIPKNAVISLGDEPFTPLAFSSAEHKAFREWFSQTLQEHRAEMRQDFTNHIDSMLLCFGSDSNEELAHAEASTLSSGPVLIEESGASLTKKTTTITSQATIDSIIEGTSDEPDRVFSRVSVSHAVQKAAAGLRSLRPSSSAKTCWDTVKQRCKCFSALSHPSSSTQERSHSEITTHLFQNAVESGNLDLIVGVLIIVNSMVMVLQLEYYGHLNEVALGDTENDDSWDNADQWFMVVEHIFNALFLLELAVRIGIYKSRFFQYPSLICDAALVVLSSVQVYFLDVVDRDEGENVSMFRVLRFIRFVRVLRLIRVLKLFASLRVLVKTVVSSFAALMWSMVLLLVIMVNGGLVLSVLLRDFIKNPGNDMVARKWVFKHYGTATRAIYTLFEVTLAGCWPNYFRPLIDHVSVWYSLFALVYVTVVVFAIIRIITAMFLKETLQTASEDAELMVRERLKHKDSYIKKLGNVFRAVDCNGDGKLNQEEFQRIFSNQIVKTWLQVLELELHDAHALFNILKNQDDEITYDEFLTGLMRLKGQARTMDVVGLMHSADKTLDAVKAIQSQMYDVRSELRLQLQANQSLPNARKLRLGRTN